MDYDAILSQVLVLLQQQKRLSYRVLKLRLQLDDDTLEALKEDLIYAKQVAVDEEGKVLVWTGDAGAVTITDSGVTQSVEPPNNTALQDLHVGSPSPAPRTIEAERRQLTVLFCDLVDSTVLASQLDPEDWREVVRAYQETCAKVIARYEGHIAQYLGDGLLVYFGYPQAHEDDAQRAVRSGLGIVEMMAQLNTRLGHERGVQLAVRLGIHTGQVVVGEIGSGAKHEQLALGETPNVAARLQGLAAPNTVVISAATFQLLGGFFACQSLGTPTLKGVSQPLEVYQVRSESTARSRLDAAGSTGLTPLVGREPEVALLRERWAQVKEGLGQVVLLSGEAGIGKSRLVEVLREQVAREGHAPITFRCSLYHTHSPFYPVIEQLQGRLQLYPDDAPKAKLDKLDQGLQGYHFSRAEMVPLLALLLSVPLLDRYLPVHQTPQWQRQQTLEALVAWLLEEAERQPVLAVWEDVHWADPSTLELLDLVIEQAPTARLLTLMTARPEFRTPWAPRSYLTQFTLGRLPRPQVEIMVQQLTDGKSLPTEVLGQVVARTDGVPLFVEELVKMLLESGLVREEANHYVLTGPLPPLAIPATLQDSLMVRLDRLVTARAVAQLGAVLGREFAYELLRAVALMDEATVQQGLAQLVEAELLYQRGRPPQARYVFKHALIQETAYQSLLKSTRQQYHQRTAQVVAERLPEVGETQPELVARHYTEAGLSAQAIPYGQRAGQQAALRSANSEAVQHLTKGLDLLATLPETAERARQELDLQCTMGPALMALKGAASPELEQTYTRAWQLCQQVEDMPHLPQILIGLARFYTVKGALERARALGEQLLQLAQHRQERGLLLVAHRQLGTIRFFQGALLLARAHVEQGISLYDPKHHHALTLLHNEDPGVNCLNNMSLILWALGYPSQALRRSHEALTLARQFSHPFTLAHALIYAAMLHKNRREGQLAQEGAEAGTALAREHGFAQWVPQGAIVHGWALAVQGRAEESLRQIRQELAAHQATGSVSGRPWMLVLLAEVCEWTGQTEEGLCAINEALVAPGERFTEAERHRLKGQLLLRQAAADGAEAEASFHQALDISRRQEAKSLELRAAMSLSRLWQQQGKRAEARELLAPIYGWFTEGFDTADLQEAKVLLEELS